MNPTALGVFIVAGVVLYLVVTGRLPAVWHALQGAGATSVSSSPSAGGALGSAGGSLPH